jgi:hypothetical protein
MYRIIIKTQEKLLIVSVKICETQFYWLLFFYCYNECAQIGEMPWEL